jgi:hypothetical protein
VIIVPSYYIPFVGFRFVKVFALPQKAFITIMEFVAYKFVRLSRPIAKDVRAMVAEEA